VAEIRTILVSKDEPKLGNIQQAYLQSHDRTTRVVAPVEEASHWDGEAVYSVILMVACLPEPSHFMTDALSLSAYTLRARDKVTEPTQACSVMPAAGLPKRFIMKRRVGMATLYSSSAAGWQTLQEPPEIERQSHCDIAILMGARPRAASAYQSRSSHGTL